MGFAVKERTIPLIQYVLFATLVVATPFVVVTRYLQGAVWAISHFTWNLFGFEVPIIASIVVLAFVAFLIWQYKNINKRVLGASGVILGMVILSQNVQDLYGDMSVYDLQRNWHYIAYSAYVYMFFQAFHVRGMSKANMVLYSFFSAVGLSIFDEVFQFFMSDRIFDISDNAKDAWGCLMGLIIVLFISEQYGRINLSKSTLWQKNLSGYFKDPLGAFAFTGSLAFSGIMLSPLLTDHRYIGLLTGVILLGWVVLMVIIHILQFKIVRKIAIVLLVLLVLGLGGSFAIHSDTGVNHAQHGLVVYKGLPVPFFDLLIYPDGFPRLVDKKHFFTGQDIQFFMKQNPDILLIGAGMQGNGGKGFKIDYGTTFMYNDYFYKGTQLIILKTPDAVKVYNRLIEEGKKVLFVIHTTC